MRVHESPIDDGPSISQLWGVAWLLGISGLAGWAYLIAQLGGADGWSSEAGAALALAVTSTVFSACCTLLVGVKSTELRLRQDSHSLRGEISG